MISPRMPTNLFPERTISPVSNGFAALASPTSPSVAARPRHPLSRLQSVTGRGKVSLAATTLDDYLPMRSTEVKNRTSTDDITRLRLITTVKTPYLPDGRFDLDAFDSLINMQIEGGTNGVIVGGTTGEGGHLMSWDEHIMLIGHPVNCFGSRIKVIRNTGSNSTREAVHATVHGFAVGMHAALHINSYYGKTSTQGIISHFEAVLPMGPTIIYNMPSRSAQDIPPEVIVAISGYTNMTGVKERVWWYERIKHYTDKGITIWSGNDNECHDSRWKYGATGAIFVASNLVPGLMHSLIYKGENAILNEKLLPLMKWLFCQPNPIALKTTLAQLNVARPIFRLPYVLLPLEKGAEFVRIVEVIGRESFGRRIGRLASSSCLSISPSLTYSFFGPAVGSWQGKIRISSIDKRCHATRASAWATAPDWENIARVCLLCALLHQSGYFKLPAPTQSQMQKPNPTQSDLAQIWQKVTFFLFISCLAIGYYSVTGDQRMMILVGAADKGIKCYNVIQEITKIFK